METIRDIIDPEVPETAEGKFTLLKLCTDALASGRTIKGVTSSSCYS